MESLVTSADGTSIAYTRRGSGPALILIGGGLDDGTENEPLAIALASEFSTYNFARRGRGDSGDTSPYAVARELEDLAALMELAGGEAHVLGVSSGGMYALEASMAGLPIASVAVYEVPYDVDPEVGTRYDDYRQQLATALAEGRRGDAVAMFMALAGASSEQIEHARKSEVWPSLERLAHTLAYDAELYGPPPTERLASIKQPTMIATGSGGWLFETAADAVTEAVPGAKRVQLTDQGHVIDPHVIAPVLSRFLRGEAP